jgi:hypothetical protein
VDFANRAGLADLQPGAARLAGNSKWFHSNAFNSTMATTLQLPGALLLRIPETTTTLLPTP